MKNYKGGSWVLSDQHQYFWLDESDDFDVLTFAKARNQNEIGECITERRLDWDGRLTARCEATYGFTTTTEPWTTSEVTITTTTTDASTTNAATTTTSAATTSAVTTTTESTGCCKTWIVRNGELKSYCTHQKVNPMNPTNRRVYECVTGQYYSDAGKS